ncbi:MULTISPECIES: hypothetical protein [Bacillaceae]|uniref:Uncharacterized protein n=2 Tax=Bacillaceae TaxID=186817 RepID=A0A9D5HZY7_9BACI|nr:MULTISPECIES: hypothetical protein [Bacillaceae]KQL56047.1 hypothetical protein AN965_15870 [Alkalicoccobacillus plakortidis]MED4129798.1 hypothetical protein [Shouchella miscanthi]
MINVNSKFAVIFLSVVTLFTFLITEGKTVNAQDEQLIDLGKNTEEWLEMEGAEVDIKVDAPYQYTEEDGSVTIFENKEDMDAYESDTIRTFVSGNRTTSTVVERKDFSRVWINYHKFTPAWSYADNYTITNGKSYTMTGNYKYKGITATISVTHSTTVSVSYPADPRRYNRLGVRSDLFYVKHKHVERTPGGKHVKTWYSERISKTGAPYIGVTYK